MIDVAMTVDGKAQSSDAAYPVTNPATGEPFATAPECSAGQLDLALSSAQRAQREWRADEPARRDALGAVRRLLDESSEDLATLLTAEQGKPLASARAEIARAAAWFAYFAELQIPRQVIRDDPQGRVEVLSRPLGVVAAITPWNYPLMLAAWKLAPALLAGNTVVLKPSPHTPLTTLRLGELLAGVLPPGVLNVVSGGDELGGLMTSHTIPRKISFTGSVEAGRSVATAAAGDFKRVTLELGGNDPAIILPDVALEAMATRMFWGAFMNSGQICSAIKRVYVPRSRYQEVAEAFAEQARAVRVGDGAVPGTELGPVSNRAQLERVTDLVTDAKAQGATVAAGGSRMNRPGYFFEPTVLVGAADGMRIVDEEQFGPALPLIAYQDVDDVIAQVNSSRFGLCGSVWSADLDRAQDLATQLECGTVWINQHLLVGPEQPFGGAKWSGLGVEGGLWGLAGFTEPQVVYRSLD